MIAPLLITVRHGSFPLNNEHDLPCVFSGAFDRHHSRANNCAILESTISSMRRVLRNAHASYTSFPGVPLVSSRFQIRVSSRSYSSISKPRVVKWFFSVSAFAGAKRFYSCLTGFVNRIRSLWWHKKHWTKFRPGCSSRKRIPERRSSGIFKIRSENASIMNTRLSGTLRSAYLHSKSTKNFFSPGVNSCV